MKWIMDFIPYEVEADNFDDALKIARSEVPNCCGGHVKNDIAKFNIPHGLNKPAIPFIDYAINQLKTVK